jgi:short-subunit dehydrogenase
VGRNTEKLAIITSDLQVRNPQAKVEHLVCDLASKMNVDQILQRIDEAITGIDLVLIAQGALPNQDDCQSNLGQCLGAIDINAVSPILFLEGFVNRMLKAGGGNIAVIGSVAGDRARKSNYVYGAAKGFVEKYVQGLQHRLAGSQVHVSLIKPGPTDTPMTAHLKAKGANLADAETVAMDIVKAVRSKQRILYTPKRWQYIMLIIRSIPFFIFKKINI